MGKNVTQMVKTVGLLLTLIVYSKIYQISFANVQTTKIHWDLTKLFYIRFYRNQSVNIRISNIYRQPSVKPRINR